jgi:hypothetical protein
VPSPTVGSVRRGSTLTLTPFDPDKKKDMKTRTIVLTLALCFVAATGCFAANPQMGTWKLTRPNRSSTQLYMRPLVVSSVSLDQRPMQIEYLADYPAHVSELARLHFEEWSYLCPGESLEGRTARLRSSCGRNANPSAVVALGDELVKQHGTRLW